jgi:general secretion pathway protein M
MTLTLSPLLRRLAAVAILLLLAGGTYLLLVAPLLAQYAENCDTVEQLSAVLARYQAAGQQLGAREAALSSLKRSDATQGGFLTGANENLIAANIQTRIKALAEGARGELKSTQILPSQDEGKLRRIVVRAQLSGTLEAAQKVFYGLEAGAPFLFLDNLTINARSVSRRRAEPEEDPLLDIQFDAYGYARNTK